MLSILLIVQIVIALLLATVILLQRTGTDGVSSLASGNNMGIVSARTAGNFLVRVTVILATCFMVNSIVLANLSGLEKQSIAKNLDAANEDKADLINLNTDE